MAEVGSECYRQQVKPRYGRKEGKHIGAEHDEIGGGVRRKREAPERRDTRKKETTRNYTRDPRIVSFGFCLQQKLACPPSDAREVA